MDDERITPPQPKEPQALELTRPTALAPHCVNVTTAVVEEPQFLSSAVGYHDHPRRQPLNADHALEGLGTLGVIGAKVEDG